MYVAWVTRIIDGDTLVAWVQLRDGIREKWRIRLHGVDTPEVRGEEKAEGLISTAWARLQLEPCESVMVVPIVVDSFGRWVCRVVYANGKDLSNELINTGHGVEYSRSATSGPIMEIPWE